MSNHSRKLIYAINKFLKTELTNGELPEESAEGVEVGIQCLEAAYNLSDSEPSLEIPNTLKEIFMTYMAEVDAVQEATTQNKTLADEMKKEGNSHMSAQNFTEAVASYTKAIKLDPKNAVFYCNRAAASNKLGQYDSCIEDCKTALKIDPSYCKAYGRLGLAYANKNQFEDAVKYYKKAVELDPENETYKSNLKLAQDSLASTSTTSTASTSMPFQNSDLSTLFTNPNILNMASQMLTNPSMQHIMNNILSGTMGQEGGGRIDVLMQASQQLAQQMENENPDLVEQLRRQMGNGGSGAGDTGSGGSSSTDNKPPNPQPES